MGRFLYRACEYADHGPQSADKGDAEDTTRESTDFMNNGLIFVKQFTNLFQVSLGSRSRFYVCYWSVAKQWVGRVVMLVGPAPFDRRVGLFLVSSNIS